MFANHPTTTTKQVERKQYFQVEPVSHQTSEQSLEQVDLTVPKHEEAASSTLDKIAEVVAVMDPEIVKLAEQPQQTFPEHVQKYPQVQYQFQGGAPFPINLLGSDYELFPSCSVTRGSSIASLGHKSIVVFEDERQMIFFFAARPIEMDEVIDPKAVVFDMESNEPS